MATATTIVTNPSALLAPVRARLEEVVSTAGGELQAAASHLLAGSGKLLRPLLVLLSARAVVERPTLPRDGSFAPAAASGDGARTRRLSRVPDVEASAALTLEADRASIPGIPPAVYDFAAAVELVHVASLIHDDVIDEAATRRSLPSVNRLFGNHTAVLAGDFLFASAFELLAPYASQGAVTWMTGAIGRMCRGELMQKERLFDPCISQKDYVERVRAKTASLLAAACEGGARLAGGDERLGRLFRSFGDSLGLAFQIADDILDLEGDAAELGKPACSDLRQGVITLPVIRLLRESPWRESLAPRIRARAIDERLLRQVQSGLRTTGAIEWARRVGRFHARRAAAQLAGLARTPSGATLISLCDAVMTRRS